MAISASCSSYSARLISAVCRSREMPSVFWSTGKIFDWSSVRSPWARNAAIIWEYEFTPDRKTKWNLICEYDQRRSFVPIFLIVAMERRCKVSCSMSSCLNGWKWDEEDLWNKFLVHTVSRWRSNEARNKFANKLLSKTLANPNKQINNRVKQDYLCVFIYQWSVCVL